MFNADCNAPRHISSDLCHGTLNDVLYPFTLTSVSQNGEILLWKSEPIEKLFKNYPINLLSMILQKAS